ncbi:MAG: CGNR zinc finger domain-containing protein [Acidimicrobiia bacterium]
MERREDLDPAMRRRFRTGRMSLDLTHTGGDGEAMRWEILHGPADVARFLGIIITTEPPVVEAADMKWVLAVRRAISDLARSRVAGVAEPRGTIGVINAAAAEPSLVPQLGLDGSHLLLPGNARQALSTIARDAVDLYSSPMAERVRICEADDCGLLFVDASRPGTRRWCSMDWCGDRAKKRAAGRPVRQGHIS